LPEQVGLAQKRPMSYYLVAESKELIMKFWQARKLFRIRKNQFLCLGVAQTSKRLFGGVPHHLKKKQKNKIEVGGELREKSGCSDRNGILFEAGGESFQ
jgi:hypothetical protein